MTVPQPATPAAGRDGQESDMATKTGTEDASPRTPRAPRKLRATTAPKALLATAAERTGDAPAPEPAETVPELTWYPTIGDVAEAKIRRWRAAMPAPIPAAQASCLSDAEMALIMSHARPPVLDEAACAESVAEAKSRYAAALSRIDGRHTAALARIDARNTQVRQEIGAACRRHQPLAPTPTAEPRALTLAEVAQKVERGELRLTFGDRAEHHETGPHSWRDTMAAELSEDGCADGEAPTDG